MAPPKTARVGQEDSKADTTSTKEKNGHGHGNGSSSNHHGGNGKGRRVGGSNGVAQRESAVPAPPTESPPAPSPPTTAPVPVNPSLQWTAFDRVVLHAYRREHRLQTPTSFASSYHQWVLSSPGGIGLYSPTMARKREQRRQSKDGLASVVRKHFNASGIQENEVIPDFLHKVRFQGGSRLGKPRRSEYGTSDHGK